MVGNGRDGAGEAGEVEEKRREVGKLWRVGRSDGVGMGEKGNCTLDCLVVMGGLHTSKSPPCLSFYDAKNANTNN